ncbi:4-epi-cubebol synthase [Streptosporangium sp. NPDC051023]|uniref:4-epi-cubebol synthase n=1 Tax=Streptosporangium sp. NPDC051023 TaxID=3155410 RepID=UPI003450945D
MSPHVERVNQENLEWLVGSGMLENAETVERYRQAKYGWLSGRTYPYAEHHLLRLVTDWCVWLFAFDDAFCESARGAAEMARALPQFYAVLEDLDTGNQVDDRFARTLLEIKGRIAVYADGDQLDRWRAVTKDYLFAQVWEAANREDEVIPPLKDYIFMRRKTGAMLTVFALIDIAGGHRLTPDEWRHPIMRAITESANDVVVWDNDLISYAKESESGNSRNNLVNVLARHRGYSRQAAMEVIGGMRNRAIADMIQLRSALEGFGSEAVRAYVRGLEFWISGSVDYSLTSSRYMHAWQRQERVFSAE